MLLTNPKWIQVPKMKSMTFHHFVLTRFSYRPNTKGCRDESGDDWVALIDPLNPSRLDFRFALFECACLPNVMAQSNQDFDWVLIVDPDLPTKYRQRLETLIAKRKRTHLHEFRHGDKLSSLEWLEIYITSDTDLVLTTNLDDDDMITVDFVEKLQLHVKGLGTTVPSIKFLGTKKHYLWDIYSSTKHPFGTCAPGHHTVDFKSAGFSMLCKISIHRLTVFAFNHSIGDVWYVQVSDLPWYKQVSDQQRAQILREARDNISVGNVHWVQAEDISKFQLKLEETSASGGDDWKSLPSTDLCYDFSKDGLFTVILNHFANDRGLRLFEYKPETVPVVDTEFFPDDFRIDWSVFHEHQDLFKLSSQQYKKYLSQINLYQKSLKLNWWKRFFLLVIMRTKLTWWYLRH